MRVVQTLLLCAGVAMAGIVPAFAAQLNLYRSPANAQRHCPHDTVVWLNLPSGIFHFKGERWYGRTRDGAYVCEREALNAGDRATRNGQ